VSGDEDIQRDCRDQLAIIRGLAEVLSVEPLRKDPSRGDFEAVDVASLTALNLIVRLSPCRFDISR